METKRLVPYSVHLPEDIYVKLKIAAGQRKASSMVRDAITMLITENSSYSSGYNKGLQDAAKIIETDGLIQGLMINGKSIVPTLIAKIEKMTVKEKANGTKKRRGN
jgi:hypothetical protein